MEENNEKKGGKELKKYECYKWSLSFTRFGWNTSDSKVEKSQRALVSNEFFQQFHKGRGATAWIN